MNRSTKDRILDAAERLFAERGFNATSLREITAEAGVNLAAVNYHFQSKEALILAVVVRRVRPVNERRLALLDECEARAGAGPLSPECVLRAFLEPMLSVCAQPHGQAAGLLIGQVFAEPGSIFRQLFQTEFAVTAQRFLGAFRRAFPDISEEDLLWRFHFTLGAAVHTMAGENHLRVISAGACDPSDHAAALEQLIAFTAAAFRAPVPALAKGGA